MNGQKSQAPSVPSGVLQQFKMTTTMHVFRRDGNNLVDSIVKEGMYLKRVVGDLKLAYVTKVEETHVIVEDAYSYAEFPITGEELVNWEEVVPKTDKEMQNA
jgi:predicted lipid carrier protein YhbT